MTYPEPLSERDENVSEVQRQAIRENAKRVMRESGMPQLLQALNRDLLKGRGTFEEYDSLVLLKWGTQSTRRHLWIEVRDSTICFRLLPHRKCAHTAPLCDGEYHIFTSTMWSNRALLARELQRYYDHPVAEASSD